MTAERVLQEVAAERLRQVELEGWVAEHDDEHNGGELAMAAACYALVPSKRAMDGGYWTHGGRDPELSKWIRPKPQLWPWHADWWKPASRRRDLIRAAAMIVAEIERLDRAGDRRQEPVKAAADRAELLRDISTALEKGWSGGITVAAANLLRRCADALAFQGES